MTKPRRGSTRRATERSKRRDVINDTLGIYLITRNDENDEIGYDEAAGFVVAAVDEESARAMIADGERRFGGWCGKWCGDEGPAPWLDSRRSTALMLGRSLPGDEPRIVLRDFRAG